MNGAIVIIGLNHSTASVKVRERITFPGDEQGALTKMFAALPGVDEVVILSTCNRAEIMAVTDGSIETRDRIIRRMASIHKLEASELLGYLYVYTNVEAVEHLFSVTASLDSMVLGEPQILGQVKGAYRKASDAKTTGPILNRMLHRSFFTAKRVRTETDIGASAVSVACVAIDLAKKILGDLIDKWILLVGAGEMAELAARLLSNQVRKPLTVVNRTFENACCLAAQFSGQAMEIEHLQTALAQADVVVTSTSSCEPVVRADQMQKVMKLRKNRPIFFVDIAIPRDVAVDVNDIDNVYVYNIDDLQSVAAENLEDRRGEAKKAGVIIEEEVTKFIHWVDTLESTPTIISFLDKLESIRTREISRLNGKLSHLSTEQREAIEILTKAMINKIAHEPITFLKKNSVGGKSKEYLDVTQRLFCLENCPEVENSGDKVCKP